ncbi:MAG: outer membrane protein assembly factor BamB family protein [Planctomycetota bacterium]|jgi:hypothetical protein
MPASRLCVGIFLCASIASAGDLPGEAALRRHGILPEAASISAHLRSLYENESTQTEFENLIERLGSRDHALRDLSARRLAAMGTAAIPALRRAARSNDPETRRHANRLLVLCLRDVDPSLLYACFRVIESRRITGLAREVLSAILYCEEEYLRVAARRALRVTCRPQDARILRRTALSGDHEKRFGAILALGALLGAESSPLLHRLADPSSPDTVRLGAACALAEQGSRDCFEPLSALLASQAPWVRQRAAQTLRAVSGVRFGYFALDRTQRRKAAADAWRDWIREHGSAATWKLPMDPPTVNLGRTLISVYGGNKVIELDATGAVTWERSGERRPWACVGLPNGHRLVAYYNDDRKVVEYDANGKEYWKRKNLPGLPTSVQRLANGNTLVACGNRTNKVVEIAPDGRIVWEVKVPGRPTDAKRIAEDRTLVTLMEAARVVEVDARGRETWRLRAVLSDPYSAQPLENGNILVSECGEGRVREFTREGSEIWSRRDFDSCYCAQRLDNGHTLIADKNGLREFDRENRVQWIRRYSTFLWFHRY